MTGDAEQTGNFTEFHRYAHRLEQMAVANFSGRPHWGKMHWSDAPTLRAAIRRRAPGDAERAAALEQRAPYRSLIFPSRGGSTAAIGARAQR